MRIAGSNVTVRDISIMGTVAEPVYIENDTAILVNGSANHRLSNFRLLDCEIKNYGFDAVQLQFIDHALIERNTVERIGHAGIVCKSCTRISIHGNWIRSITPGQKKVKPEFLEPAYYAYGITFTHDKDGSPPSTDCVALNNRVENIPSWSGIDSHSGSKLLICNNFITNCRSGISVGAAIEGVHMIGIQILGNQLLNDPVIFPNAHKVNGIIVHGSSTLRLKDAIIAGNLVRGFGGDNPVSGSVTHAALLVQFTDNVIVTVNLITSFKNAGIRLFTSNRNFLLSSNFIDDGIASPAEPAIKCDKSNFGFISGNRGSGVYSVDSGASVVIGSNDFRNGGEPPV